MRNIDTWFKDNTGKINEVILTLREYALSSCGKGMVGKYQVEFKPDGRVERLGVKIPGSRYAFDFLIETGSADEQSILLDIERVNLTKMISEVVFINPKHKEEGYHYRCDVLSTADNGLLLTMYWSVDTKELTNIAVQQLESGSFACYYGGEQDWQLSKLGRVDDIPPPLYDVIKLPASIKNVYSIMGVKIPWILSDMEERLKNLMDSFDFDEFTRTVKNNPITPVLETAPSSSK